MDRNAIVNEVISRLDLEVDDVQFSKDDVLDAVHDGYRELGDAAEFYEEEVAVLCTTNTYYNTVDLDLKTLTLKAIRNPNTDRFLEMKSVDDLDKKYTRDWEMVTGEPEFYFTRGLFHIGVFPKKATATGQLEFFQSSEPPLLSPAQEPQLVYERQFALIEYAMYSLLRDYGEINKALIHWANYLAHETKLVTEMRSRMRSRWGIIG